MLIFSETDALIIWCKNVHFVFLSLDQIVQAVISDQNNVVCYTIITRYLVDQENDPQHTYLSSIKP